MLDEFRSLFEALRARMFRRLALSIQARFNRFDRSALASFPQVTDLTPAPIFIIAPPRTGSTLIYQALVRSLRIAYISNLMAAFPRYMVRLTQLNRHHKASYSDEFHPGSYGFVPGLLAPSEAGKVMDRWFDPSLIEQNRKPVRSMLAALSANTDAPLLVKSLSLTLKLNTVLEIAPEARFLVLSREPAFAIQSMLLGRQDPSITEDRWAGVEPPGFARRAPEGLPNQLAWQYAELRSHIERGLAGLPLNQVFELDYDAFCCEPARFIDRIGTYWGIQKTGRGLPPNIASSRARKVDERVWRDILSACQRHGMPVPEEDTDTNAPRPTPSPE